MEQFKIGDWIRFTDGTVQQLEREGDFVNVSLWRAKAGEWCWYGFELVQVIDVQPDHIKICRQLSDSFEELSFDKVEPFIGELPSFIKEK